MQDQIINLLDSNAIREKELRKTQLQQQKQLNSFSTCFGILFKHLNIDVSSLPTVQEPPIELPADNPIKDFTPHPSFTYETLEVTKTTQPPDPNPNTQQTISDTNTSNKSPFNATISGDTMDQC